MHWIRYLTSLLITCDVASALHRRHGRDAEESKGGRNANGYSSADQHPELRSSVGLRSDDDKTEFVRQEWTETVYKKIRTYSKFIAVFVLSQNSGIDRYCTDVGVRF
ncbi:hypothetical protein Y032_0007g3336 [Ancylostoma ceylanicum]|uniref:Secreted protein n=1 Tax=Ancylostoma ceylanicum TaxID=53326 RepID=A0A016VML4_9BILA|nr:hypothetical protein Y032_0007g3336 [Ancylostoma ceylanicum]